jgi:hypothetical protein
MRGLRELLLERSDECRLARGEQLDRVQVLIEGRLRAPILEAQRAQPCHVLGSPVATRALKALAAAHHAYAQAVARAHQVTPHVLDHANQVAEALIGDARREREGQFAGGQERAGRIASRLSALRGHPVPRVSTPGSDADVQAPPGARPGQPEAGRAGLIDGEHVRAELGEKLRHPAWRHPQSPHSDLAGVGIEHRGVCLASVHIQADGGL